MVKDPVCGMEVGEKTAAHKSIQAGNVYYFCSSSCQADFIKAPEKYIGKGTEERHASHYGGYCGTSGCGVPARGLAWYFYVGLLILLLLAVFLFAL